MKILYKYVSAQRAIRCIPEVGDGTLRATQPVSLNDPFECAFATSYVMEEREENHELARILTGINKSKPVTGKDVHLARQQYGRLFTRQLVVQQLSTRFGVVSLASDYRHILLWSYYATDGDGSGFVIGYDSEKLRKLVGPKGSLNAVRYLDEPPVLPGPEVIEAPDNLHQFLSIKSSLWAYEAEQRLIVEMGCTIGTGESDPHGQPINLIRVPNETVVRVYYVERTPPESVKLIGNRLADQNNRYRATKPEKLIQSFRYHKYEEALTGNQS